MIVTVTLNPAVDKTCRTDRVLPGEVNRLQSAMEAAGGKGVNVAKVLRQFHLPVAVMGFLGGYSGRLIEDSMSRMGAECRFTRIRGNTRTNTNILGADGCVTELLEPGPVISPKELEKFEKEFEYSLETGELFVLSGSAPEGIAPDIYHRLIQKCSQEHKKVFLDTSGELLREGVRAKPYLIKPNRRELEYLAGRGLGSREEVIAEAKKLVTGGIRKVVVSLGTEGLLYVDENQTLYEPAKSVKTVNTVGCGDSVVASFCMSEISGEDAGTALKKAAALAAANAATAENAQIPMNTYLNLL